LNNKSMPNAWVYALDGALDLLTCPIGGCVIDHQAIPMPAGVLNGNGCDALANPLCSIACRDHDAEVHGS
jgi:hypothetical protein